MIVATDEEKDKNYKCENKMKMKKNIKKYLMPDIILCNHKIASEQLHVILIVMISDYQVNVKNMFSVFNFESNFQRDFNACCSRTPE